MSSTRATQLLLAVTLASLLGACSVGYYVRDRIYDVPDIVDLKYGGGLDTLGLGFKLEITEFIGLGLGYGNSDSITEWRGRRRDIDDNTFLHVIMLGRDGPTDRPANYFWTWNVFYYSPGRDQWRVGLEVLVPLVHLGFSFNIYEAADLIGGVIGFDPSDDDGIPFGAPVEVNDW